MNSTDIILIVMTVIQTVEMYLIVKNHVETNRILKNPGPLVLQGIIEFIDQLGKDEKKQKYFMTFLAIIGQNVFLSLKDACERKGIKIPKIKSATDIIDFVVKLPNVAENLNTAISQSIKEISGEAPKKSPESSKLEGW